MRFKNNNNKDVSRQTYKAWFTPRTPIGSELNLEELYRLVSLLRGCLFTDILCFGLLTAFAILDVMPKGDTRSCDLLSTLKTQ